MRDVIAVIVILDLLLGVTLEVSSGVWKMAISVGVMLGVGVAVLLGAGVNVSVAIAVAVSVGGNVVEVNDAVGVTVTV